MKQKFPPKATFAISMAIFGTIGVLTRLIPLSSSEIALYRAILASAVLTLVLALKKKKPRGLNGRNLFLLFFSGAAMGFNWIFLFEAYNYTSITAATLSYYFAPTLVILASPIILGEKLTKGKVLCFILSTLGLVLVIAGGGSGSGSNNTKGVLMGLAAAVLYATVIITNKKICGMDGIERTLMQFLAAIIVLTPYVASTSGFNFLSLEISRTIPLLILGIIHTGITYAMYFSSLVNLKGSEISILSYIDPLTAMLISAFILSEPTTFLQIIGGALILGGTLIGERISRK
ncbi:MAG: DMT family transporter [Candidatus Ornithospirochaeta sp.]